jgi:pyruvyl transferase EpsO
MSHKELMSSLADKHSEIIKLIDNSPVHFIDIPVHGNIGDLLILLGTLKLFNDNKTKCKLMTTYANYSGKWATPDTVIVFQGGGNLGDLYLEPQTSRESIIDELVRNRIVILPQTIHFDKQENFERCKRIFSKHPDLHIFTRDQKSFEHAKLLTNNVYLTPDIAHQLWPLKRTKEPTFKKLGLVRVDSESSGDTSATFDHKTDWPELVGSLRKAAFNNIMRTLKFQRYLGLDRTLVTAQMNIWNSYANKLVTEAVDLFSSHEEIYTDRLHGHILSCLLSIPHTISDNSYGKNFSYVNLWTATSDIVTLGQNK